MVTRQLVQEPPGIEFPAICNRCVGPSYGGLNRKTLKFCEPPIR